MLSGRNGDSKPRKLNQGDVTVATQALQQRLVSNVQHVGSVGSEASVAALPTSVAGDFYSPEALRLRLASPDLDVLQLQVASSTKAKATIRVKPPPPQVRQWFTDEDWAAWTAHYVVVEPEPLRFHFPAKVC